MRFNGGERTGKAYHKFCPSSSSAFWLSEVLLFTFVLTDRSVFLPVVAIFAGLSDTPEWAPDVSHRTEHCFSAGRGPDVSRNHSPNASLGCKIRCIILVSFLKPCASRGRIEQSYSCWKTIQILYLTNIIMLTYSTFTLYIYIYFIFSSIQSPKWPSPVSIKTNTILIITI